MTCSSTYNEKFLIARMGILSVLSSSSLPNLFFSTYLTNTPMLQTKLILSSGITQDICTNLCSSSILSGFSTPGSLGNASKRRLLTSNSASYSSVCIDQVCIQVWGKHYWSQHLKELLVYTCLQCWNLQAIINSAPETKDKIESSILYSFSTFCISLSALELVIITDGSTCIRTASYKSQWTLYKINFDPNFYFSLTCQNLHSRQHLAWCIDMPYPPGSRPYPISLLPKQHTVSPTKQSEHLITEKVVPYSTKLSRTQARAWSRCILHIRI